MDKNMPIGDKPTEKYIDTPINWRIYSIQELIDKKHLVGHLDGNHGELYPSSHEFTEVGIPYIGANDFSNGYIDYKSCKFLPEERARIFKKGIAKDGDVLFAHNATVGPVALIKTKLEYVILSTTATYFRCNQEKLFNIFLLYALQAPFFVSQYQSVMAQSTRNQVPITVQRKFSLLLPPLPEQKTIAQSLSDVDAQITALDQLITKKRNAKQGTMQQLLTGKKRLPGFSSEWEVKKLGEVTEFLDGKRIPLKDSDRAKMRGQYPYYGASGIIDYVNDYIFDDELILLGEDGDNILSRNSKLAFKVCGKIWINNHAHVLKPKPEVEINFLTEYLESLNYEQYNTGTAQPKINQKVCSSIPVPLPCFSEQKAIAQVLSDMDAEIATLEQKRDKYKIIKQGMIQELLTGKTRLKVEGEENDPD